MRLTTFNVEHEKSGHTLDRTEETTIRIVVDAPRSHGETIANKVEGTVADYIRNINEPRTGP